MKFQKICGICLILSSVWLADFFGKAPVREDGGGAILFFLLGVVLVVSNRKIISTGRDDYE